MTFRDYRLLQRIWHRASGDYFDIVSERFDRHADTSKNIRDVSKPETALLLMRLLLLLQTHGDAQLARSSRLDMPAESVNVSHLFRQL